MEQFLQTACPSCQPTISVKALKEIQSTDPNQWPGLVLSVSTNRLLIEAPFMCTIPSHYQLCIILAASPLDPHDAQQIRPLLGRLLLQADTVA